MKIIVQNETERELIKNFAKVLNDLDGIDDLERVDHDPLYSEEPYLTSAEYRLIANEFNNLVVQIDPKVNEMCFEDDSIVVGDCVNCGKHTEGITRDNLVTYIEYLNYSSKEEQEKWLCEDCYNKKIKEDDE